jgi:hypothetical protein
LHHRHVAPLLLSKLALAIKRKHRSSYEMPAARADMGTKEWLVMPGEVFISSKKALRSLARIIKSARPQPRQPRLR